jgi:hypothetical protein
VAFLGYVIGAAALVVAVGSIVGGAKDVRRSVLPSWTGPLGALVVAVVSLALVTVVSELLGSVGLFRVFPLAVALVGAGVGARFVARAQSSRPAARAPVAPDGLAPNLDRWARRVGFVAVLVVFSEWLTATVRSFQAGMTAVDANWYHMPTAAHFAQSGSTWHLHIIDTTSLTVFYPAGSELMHAAGMVFLHTDALSRVLNLGWLALALLAAWCIGARFGVASLSLLGASLLFATPQLVALEAGQALNDVAVTALLLAAVAVIVNAVGSDSNRLASTPPVVVAAMAAGLAAGTKWTALVSVAALTVGIPFVSERADRIKNSAVWLGVVALSGGYWYVRNIVAAGSPVPPQRIGLGPIELPYAPPGISTFSLTHYLTDSDAWNHVIRPGLRATFGPLWWFVLLLALGGLALGFLLPRDRVVRVASVVGVACVASYLLTKQGFNISFWPGTPRYAAPGLAIGLVVLPVALLRMRPRALVVVLVAYAATLAVTQVDSRLWRSWWTGDHLAVGAAVTATVLVGIAIAGRPAIPTRVRLNPTPAIGVSVLVVALAAGIALDQYRPAFAEHGTPGERAASLLRARNVHHARIALTGSLLISGSQYDFSDKRLTNRVQFIAQHGSKHRVFPFTRCASFVRSVDAGRYDYVVTPAPTAKAPEPASWLGSSDAARRLNGPGLGGAAVFEITGPLDPSTCRDPG